MTTPSQTLKKQAGMMLLEALIAILIFSLGILALVGMQAAAVKNVGEAKYRAEAALLADSLLGTMRATDRTLNTLETRFKTGGEDYNTWLQQRVTAALPGVTTYPPIVDVTSEGMVIVTIRWLAPGTTDSHKYIAVAQIK
jgi:type IV pilus assembly protein PilV